MEPTGGIELLKPQLSGLRSAIEWLSARGLPATRLAGMFGTNANHIRQLVYRARHVPFQLYAPASDLSGLVSQPGDSLRAGLKIRPGEDDIVLPASRQSRISRLKAEIDQITAATKDLEEGARKLRRLLPHIGYPGQIDWLRLSARIHQQIAWCLGHSGYSTSAFGEAKIALNLSRVAYAEWQDAKDLKCLTETCLIAANSCLLIGDAESARKYLQIAKDASEATHDPRGSEHYRQLGVAYFQLGEDELAEKHFREAPEAMEAKAEAENPAHMLMTGKRHLALLGRGNWEGSQEILAAVRREYAPGSLQHVMMLNSAAASGLLTDSPQVAIAAQEILATNRELAQPYHHQLTRMALLSLTPALPAEIRPMWIRRALYENAFKDQ